MGGSKSPVRTQTPKKTILYNRSSPKKLNINDSQGIINRVQSARQSPQGTGLILSSLRGTNEKVKMKSSLEITKKILGIAMQPTDGGSEATQVVSALDQVKLNFQDSA